jgi:hypothetical protein
MTIKTRAEQMTDDMRGAIELMHLPGGPAQFQRIIAEAEGAEVADFDGIAHLISIANACLAVVDAGVAEQTFVPWYQDKARNLLAKAMGGLAVAEAMREPKPAASLN